MFENVMFHQAVYWIEELKKRATLSNLQIGWEKKSNASIVPWEVSQKTQVKMQPTHTTPPAAIQPPSLCQWTDTLCLTPTYCLCPIQQYDVESYHTSRCRGRGTINFMLQTSMYGHTEHSGDCPTLQLHIYDSQPNSMEVVNNEERRMRL